MIHPDLEPLAFPVERLETLPGNPRKGGRYRSATSAPGMIRHRARSLLWRMDRRPSMVRGAGRSSSIAGKIVSSEARLTASFEFVGPPAPPEVVAALA